MIEATEKVSDSNKKKLFALSYDLSTPLTNYGSVPED